MASADFHLRTHISGDLSSETAFQFEVDAPSFTQKKNINDEISFSVYKIMV